MGLLPERRFGIDPVDPGDPSASRQAVNSSPTPGFHL
jgi:hypothetical protein